MKVGNSNPSGWVGARDGLTIFCKIPSDRPPEIDNRTLLLGENKLKFNFIIHNLAHWTFGYMVATVETLYSTIYYSKYFIELNFDKSTQYVALWTHKRHPIPRPFGRAMECLLWVFHWNWPCYKGFLLYFENDIRDICQWCSSRALLVKSLSCKQHKNQHWLGNGLVQSGNK